MDDDVLRLGADQTLRVLASTPNALELESTWATASQRQPPRHYHPRQDEHFEILGGQVTVELDQQPPRVLNVGDTLDVPRGTRHRMWNAGTEPARALWTVTPRLRSEEMFRHIHGGLSPLRTIVLLWKFRDEYRLAVRR